MLEFRLFGPFEALRDGVLIRSEEWKRKKTQALCKILVSERGRVFTTDQLVDTLFPDLEIDKAYRNLRARVSELRRVLEPELEKGNESEYVIKHGEGYQFSRSIECDVDMEVFESNQMIAMELQQTDRWGQAIERYRRIRNLYRGEFLADDIYEDWTATTRERFKTRLLEAHLHEAQCHVRLGAYATAIELCDLALEIERHYEPAYRDKMLFQYYAGNEIEALSTYDKCLLALEKALNATPSDETSELRDLILRGKIPLPHKAISNNLPAQSAQFVGRSSEIDQIEEILATRDARLITLLGPGGVGKSSLGLEIAQRALEREDFKDGIYFVALAPVAKPEHIVSAIAQALDFSFYGNADPQEQLFAFLDSKEVLIVLDNFEHLLDGTGLIAKFIESTQNLTLLITTRERVKIKGERLFSLSGLHFPEEFENLESKNLAKYDAIQLFIDRAKRVRSDYLATHEDLLSIARICQILDGIPLGIELSAPWIRLYAPSQILAEISNSIDFLTSELHDVPDRHRSIRAVFEQSWSLLSEEEQKIFTSLTVFRGGFSTDAAVYVSETTPSALISLMDKSFIESQQHGRLSIHELLRQLGEEKLSDNPTQYELARSNHSEHFSKLLAESTPQLKNENQRIRINMIRDEIDNIRAFWDREVELQSSDMLKPALDGLFYFFDIESRNMDGAEIFESAIEIDDQDLQTHLSSRLGWFLFRLGQFDRAEALFEEALQSACDLDNQSEIAFTSNYLGILKRVKGEKERAEELHTADLEISKKLQDSFGIARASNNLGIVKQEQGEYDEANDLYKAALSIYEKLGNQLGMSKAYNNLGVIARLRGQTQEAQAYYEKTVEIDKAVGDQFGISITLLNLGNTARDLGDIEKAKGYYAEALEIAKSIGEKYSISILLTLLGVIAHEEGEVGRASKLVGSSLRTSREIDALPISLETLVNSVGLLSDCLDAEEFSELLGSIADHPSASEAVRAEARRELEKMSKNKNQAISLSDEDLISLVRTIEDRLLSQESKS